MARISILLFFLALTLSLVIRKAIVSASDIVPEEEDTTTSTSISTTLTQARDSTPVTVKESTTIKVTPSPIPEKTEDGNTCTGKLQGVFEHTRIVEMDAGEALIRQCEGRESITWEGPKGKKIPVTNDTLSLLPQYNDTGFYYCLVGEEKRPSFSDLHKCSNWIYVYVKDDNHVFLKDDTPKYIAVEEGNRAVLPCQTVHKDLTVELYREDTKVQIGVEDIINQSFWRFIPHTGFVLNKSYQKHSGEYKCTAVLKNQTFHLVFFLDVINCSERKQLALKLYRYEDPYIACSVVAKKKNIINSVMINGNEAMEKKSEQVRLCNKMLFQAEVVHLTNDTSNQINVTCKAKNFTDVEEKSFSTGKLETLNYDKLEKVYERKINHTFKESVTLKQPTKDAEYTITWYQNEKIIKRETNITSTLEIKKLEKKHVGNYGVLINSYKGARSNGKENWMNFTLLVLFPPEVDISTKDHDEAVEITCSAKGYPPPMIYWEGDHKLKGHEDTSKIDLTVISKITLGRDGYNNVTCFANNSEGNESRSYSFDKLERPDYSVLGNRMYLGIIIAIVILMPFIFMFGYRCKEVRRMKKNKRQMKELFSIDRTSKLFNPDLPYDRQLEALPYDKRWEFPEKKLKMGVLLGSGQFGVVRKAEAHFILPGEAITVVAVKISKSFDCMSMEALKSELKIMANLGQHLNVVNLLGACTQNISKGELKLIVEYCHLGNLHDYLHSNRQNFINQVNSLTGEIDIYKTERPARKRSRVYYTKLFFGITTEENASSKQLGEENNAIPETEDRRSLAWTLTRAKKITSGNKLKSLFCTQDLLCWSFQVARGMEYLASRKVFHGDLAARNTLLTENNVVKIGDFGLSKKLYRIRNYKETKHGLVPLKWMAIEYLKDNIYSTESDVWSFGILLWEYFTLGETPYPGMEADEHLFNKLKSGYRMGQPKYAPAKIYNMIQECWYENPIHRPSFEELAERLGNMLCDKVRKHYVQLDNAYAEMDTPKSRGIDQQDVLSLMRAPTYGNAASVRKSSCSKGRAEREVNCSLNPDPLFVCERVGGSSARNRDNVESSVSTFEDARDCACIQHPLQPCVHLEPDLIGLCIM